MADVDREVDGTECIDAEQKRSEIVLEEDLESDHNEENVKYKLSHEEAELDEAQLDKDAAANVEASDEHKASENLIEGITTELGVPAVETLEADTQQEMSPSSEEPEVPTEEESEEKLEVSKEFEEAAPPVIDEAEISTKMHISEPNGNEENLQSLEAAKEENGNAEEKITPPPRAKIEDNEMPAKGKVSSLKSLFENKAMQDSESQGQKCASYKQGYGVGKNYGVVKKGVFH